MATSNINEQLNQAAGSISNAFSSFTASLKPLGNTVGKQWVQVQQFAREKIISNADVTELPAEYRQLEEKVDRVELMTRLFLRISRNYGEGFLDYEPPVADKLNDFASVVQANASQLAERLSGTQLTKTPLHHEVPPCYSHALSKAAFQSTELISEDEPLGAGLKKFATTYERIGNHKMQHNTDALLKFHNPMTRALEGRIQDAMKARKQVQACRLTYDSCRARLKSAAPNRAELIRAEMVESEDEFVAAVDEAINKMKSVVESGEALRCLSDLVAIELQYHKAAFEALSQLGPELDELVVSNEALTLPP